MTFRSRLNSLRRVRVVKTVELTQPGRLLAGKTVLITGAGRNIGRATALECAGQGAQVIAMDLDGKAARRTADEVGGIARQADITDPDQVQAAMTGLPEIDVLVNNVGIGRRAGVLDYQAGDWRATFETNVLGPMWLTHLCAQGMRRGSIVMISSIHESVPRADAAYGASKGAVAQLVKELALELAPRAIRVNGIAPGSTKADPRGTARPDQRDVLHGTSVPPEYIGRAVVFLASDYFSLHTTGATLTVDAGLSLLTASRIR